MILHTGGLALGDTSTRSSPASTASSRALSIPTIPNCSPSLSISLTAGAPFISSFILKSFIQTWVKLFKKRVA
jgi:hypothetical protein